MVREHIGAYGEVQEELRLLAEKSSYPLHLQSSSYC